jgi:hypothetical protein
MTRKNRLNLLPKRRRFLLFVFALAAMLLRTASVTATTIVNDTWQDGEDNQPASPAYSEYGTDSDADGDLESAWFQGGAGSLNPVGLGGPERADLTGTGASSASWTTYFTPEASPVTLANTGDSLKLTWVFKASNINATNTSQNLRFAIVDSPSAQRLTANGAPGSGAYTGYAMFANMGQTLGNSNPFRLEKRGVASGDLLSTSGNWSAVGTTGATSGNHGYDNGTTYTLEWTLTRNAASGLDQDIKMSGGTLNGTGTAEVLFTDPAPGSLGGFTFDTFALRPSGETTTASIFDTSLFKVETNTALTPEPNTLVLLGFGSLGFGAVRRRRGAY